MGERPAEDVMTEKSLKSSESGKGSGAAGRQADGREEL